MLSFHLPDIAIKRWLKQQLIPIDSLVTSQREVHYLENSLTVIALPCDIVTCTKLKVFKSVG